MAVKKSELYRSLWSSCDELRGGMDASQYKDYVLTLLFLKYVSDKYAGKANALVKIPENGSFEDIVKLRGDKDIGEKINKVLHELAEVNARAGVNLVGVIDIADFDSDDKLGSGREKQNRLSNLVGIFAGIDLSANRAEGDDLLGDAYEYLMRHFATESGKSKGQFYTPSEVSRVMARLLRIDEGTDQYHSVYDPACGSGSLLLKVSDAAPHGLSIFGQEMDNATWALCTMNMFLHDAPDAEILKGNSLADPKHKDEHGDIETFDFVVANPPFSTKSWSNGLDPANDEYRRFEFGIPPAKNGDYAFLSHAIRSLKSTGRGAIIMPHGVLFRGNVEAAIRRNILRQGFIEGIIGLPPNLFYGTGIPACIIVLDKANASHRREVFLIDASRGFMKDGNKNRLRSQDMHKIVDVFVRKTEVPRYSRLVPFKEIEKNDFNLNIPRYVDSSEPEDLQDLGAHLSGGIPERDVAALSEYWNVFPTVEASLFADGDRPGYRRAAVKAEEVRDVVLNHPEFEQFSGEMRGTFDGWREAHAPALHELGQDEGNPKALVRKLSEDLLARFEGAKLVNHYDVYQHLMDYWADEMQDDVYAIVQDGWGVGRILRDARKGETAELAGKVGKKQAKLVGEIIPAQLVIRRFYRDREEELTRLAAELDEATQTKTEFEEEHGAEEGDLSDLEGNGIAKGAVLDRVMEIKSEVLKKLEKGQIFSDEYKQAKAIKKGSFGTAHWQTGIYDEEGYFARLDLLHEYLRLVDAESRAKAAHRAANDELTAEVISRYPKLTEEEIKALVIEDKWMSSVERGEREEIDRVARTFAGRVRVLEARYAEPLPELTAEAESLSKRVEEHLRRMGVEWTARV
jgi:type I restriction enzyme M protein